MCLAVSPQASLEKQQNSSMSPGLYIHSALLGRVHWVPLVLFKLSDSYFDSLFSSVGGNRQILLVFLSSLGFLE